MKTKTFLARLLNHLTKNDFFILGVDDGESFTRTYSKKETLELLCNLDESSLIVRNNEVKKRHFIMLVIESPEYKEEDLIDIICDWSSPEIDLDGFERCVNEFVDKYNK